MGTVVGGFLLPHDPMMLTHPDAPPAPVRDRVHHAYAEISRRLAALDPTTVLIIGADHYILFGPGCLPQMLIATGDLDGPVERLPGLTRGPLPDNAPLARHIAAHGHRNGVDWAVAPTFTADHSVVIPYHLVAEPLGVPVIPVYLACGVEPLIPLPRAVRVGEAIRAAVQDADEAERVVVIGSGGISHWVGTERMGELNTDFDRMVLDRVTAGDTAGLAALDDGRIQAEAGNGALEIRTFVTAMAAVGPCRGEVIGYEAVPEWITGLGFAELLPLETADAR
ncbi:protocatechuate 4,5-dioxygenase beta chain [Actinomadura pelletieri DSM 43383]|uniref:Protocatechuate 4,5-dioxygenase beta chain n=1 Tax=Actinomadura pelletieri DSM 43383 TaxID=1120940 RepID=A0A495QT38_9ACTN|nr:protocatechuate 3,4-dioxygenase [Actinomadura pelletieri]RKS76679.1 protocatechuate 4,5-dioxygenase beta chain [Actinomadura pelletieri DSM 43383]